MSTYGKLNFLPITGIYLVFFFLEMQKKLVQTKVYYKLCYSVWKETCHKPLKVAAAKNSFPNVYIIDATCFGECFLFYVITGRHYFSCKFIVTQRLVKPPCCVLWEKLKDLEMKIVYIFPRCIYNKCYVCNFSMSLLLLTIIVTTFSIFFNLNFFSSLSINTIIQCKFL